MPAHTRYRSLAASQRVDLYRGRQRRCCLRLRKTSNEVCERRDVAERARLLERLHVEIKKVARNNPTLAAEGAVRFLEKLSPALEQIDSSSGAIGTAVNHAIEGLVPVISGAVVDAKTRDRWLERLWQAHADDGVPYIERLGDFWGELCASREVAADWADRLVGIVERSWSVDPSLRAYFHGTTACMSALLQAQRHEQILSLLEKAPYRMWHYRKWGVKALVGLGRKADALRYAEASRGLNDSPVAIAKTCELKRE
jgi:hypothetical protein